MFAITVSENTYGSPAGSGDRRRPCRAGRPATAAATDDPGRQSRLPAAAPGGSPCAWAGIRSCPATGPVAAGRPPDDRSYEPAGAGSFGVSASCNFFVSSSERDVLITVPPYWLSEAVALSGVTCSTIMNSADVPGLT